MKNNITGKMKRLTLFLASLTLLFATICMSGCFNRHSDNNTTGKSFTHDGVDLGLPSGNIWATYNVGAHAPEERGYYIEWIDNKELGEKFNWEKGWRVPSEDEWVELYQNCTYTMENRQDHNGKTIGGMVFRASNGNSIFLPAIQYNDQWGYYWSCTPYPLERKHVMEFSFVEDEIGVFHKHKNAKGFIRPVHSK